MVGPTHFANFGDIAAYGLPDYLRITIGREDEMQAVIGALEEFMK